MVCFGVAVMLGNTAVCAIRTTKHCVTLFTNEVAYVALTHRENTYLSIQAVLEFVQPHLKGSVIVLYEDNEGARALPENLQGSQLSKHIDVHFRFLRGRPGSSEVTMLPSDTLGREFDPGKRDFSH